MTIESQLERICVALEAISKAHAGPLFNNVKEVVTKVSEATDVKVAEVVHEKAKTETKKVEVRKEEPKPDPETPAGGLEVVNKASFDDLADKVKALGRVNRDSVLTLFKQFGIERLGGLEEKDYIAFDIAIAKAVNASKGE